MSRCSWRDYGTYMSISMPTGISFFIRSIKRYFLLDQADFVTHFLDLAESDLQGSFTRVPVEKLQSLLELVLRSPSSVSVNDPFKDELRVTIQRKGTRLVDQLFKLSN